MWILDESGINQQQGGELLLLYPPNHSETTHPSAQGKPLTHTHSLSDLTEDKKNIRTTAFTERSIATMTKIEEQ